MEKDKAIVFKCPGATLNEMNFPGHEFAYFYIHLLATESGTKQIAQPSKTGTNPMPFQKKN